MGKKDKKKGKGAEKTAAKTERKQLLKQKKELAAAGEDDIEKIVAQIEEEEKAKQEVVEKVIAAPTRRSNFSFTPHPDKDELILFGGEFFNGQKTTLFNDFLFYNIPRSEWRVVSAPGAPPPRCSHQAVAVSSAGGQLWIFGGEYASPSESQFYHYKDLWVFHFATKKWEKKSIPNGPSARSGHRMICHKKHLVVFGGFHDNLRVCKYFNDVYAYNLETNRWKKIEPTGTPPTPRSGCQMASLPDGRILISGGYSKEKLKRDLEKGTVHTDMFYLVPDKTDDTFTKWKWVSMKQFGARPSPRCGFSLAVAPNGHAYCFGGVYDVEDSEEEISGTFFNDLVTLELEKAMWRTVSLSGNKDTGKIRKKRRREKSISGKEDQDVEMIESSGDEEEEEPLAKELQSVAITGQSSGTAKGTEEPQSCSSRTTFDDGIFCVTVGPSLNKTERVSGNDEDAGAQAVFTPSPRMNAGLAIKKGTLYLYGGMIEEGERELTLADFYSLDLRKLNEWKTLIANDIESQEWVESDSESSEEGSESEEDEESDGAQEEDKMDTT